MNEKQQKIITSLLENQDRYLTSQYLATKLSVTDRTIRTYIKEVRPLIESNGGLIHSKTGHGFQLEIVEENKFNRFLNEQQLKSVNIVNQSVVNDSEDRQNFILNKLLLEEAVLNIEDLSEELFISLTSINKDVSVIKKRLKPYNLKIASKVGIGFWVEGLEMDKRHFIMDAFFGKNYNNPLKEYLGNNALLKEISFEELTIIVLDEVREEKLKISDIIIQNLVLHLALAMKRISEGFDLKEIDIEINESNQIEYKVAINILTRVEEALDLLFPNEEVFYLTLHLMAKSNQQSTEINDELNNNLSDAIEKISDSLTLNLRGDYQLHNGLLEHLKPMLVRLEKGIVLRNPLLDTLKEEYPGYFELTKKEMGQMPVLNQYEISDDEWAYLSLHVMGAIEKAKNSQKLQVLIICATGYGSAQLLRNRVINEFGSYLNVVDVMGYYEINEFNLLTIDLIISSINLSSVIFKVPTVHVSVFLNDEDISLIKSQISQINTYQQKSLLDKKIINKDNEKHVYVKNSLKKECFVIYSTEPTKEQVIQDLLERISFDEAPGFIEKMTYQIQQREFMGQTVFSETIVVPHPAKPISLKAKVAVAIIPDGMKWDKEEGVKFIFLLSPSFIENNDITILTKGIVALVEQLDRQDMILSHVTFENFREVFLSLIE